MKSRMLIVALAVLVALTMPALAGNEQAHHKAMKAAKGDGCTAETQDCLNKMAVNLKHKGWVGIEMDKGDDDRLTVTRVEPDSPALEAGLREGDVLVARNGVRFDAVDDHAKKALMKSKKSMEIGATVTYTVERNGREKDVDVTLGSIPDDIIAKWIGRHMLEHATFEMAQN